ncbi:MAG: efflux RND transporter periplasmic adaptor subunit [Planctomycetaceae bacterium]
MRLPSRVPSRRVLTLVALVLVVGLGWLTFDHWRPLMQSAWASITAPPTGEAPHGHDHGPAGEAEPGAVVVDWIQLTDQARRNIGLRTGEITVGNFTRTVTVPGIVAERPGRTTIRVAAPLTGVVTDVFAEPGQAVKPGEVLFILRLNREEVVEAQSAFLQTLEAIAVESKEIERLESIRSGVIAEKVILERKFERQKLEARERAERQALLLLGLAQAQVDAIARDRTLLQEFRVLAPVPHDETAAGHLESAHGTQGSLPESLSSPRLILDELAVAKGDAVSAGTELCTLADMDLLYLEGRAYERDAPALSRAAEEGWTVAAVPEAGGEAIGNLEIAHVENRVNAENRTLIFRAFLPNAILHETAHGERRFPTWRFKPGQRMQVKLPVEHWKDKIVLPAAALAQEGPDRYVFVENGPRFDRRAVVVEYADAEHVVIANDGSLFPGDVVALNAAHQLLMALKNRTVDPSVAAHGHMH